MIYVKRVYDAASSDDGLRVLVDRLWPRGVSKERAQLDRWAKELAPSNELRKWFAHDPDKWAEFKKRYALELKEQREDMERLAKESKSKKFTLLYGARDEVHNEAVALKEFLEKVVGST
ncbi:MAG TPA: DUF488 domain-containing protein [Fimbriimonadaceae bacterium]|jgi:uncharacterized protein YeaO (DUF488 family)